MTTIRAAMSALLVLAPTAWGQCETEKLIHPSLAPNDKGGDCVAIWGDLAAVGVSAADGDKEDSGRVELWTRASGAWVHLQTIDPPKETEDGRMGVSVAMANGVLVVGEPRFALNAKGVAYLYSVDGSGATLLTTLSASDGQNGNEYGFDVATDGTWVVVGAYGHAGKGAAYAYRKDSAGAWVEHALVPQSLSVAAEFGISVDVSVDRIVVGARYDGAGGAVHFFDWAAGSWQALPPVELGALGVDAELGVAAAIDEDVAVVGANRANDPFTGQLDVGAVVVFERGPFGWTALPPLFRAGGQPGERFGHAVAITDDRIVVGANAAEVGGVATGSAFVFRKAGSTLTQVQRIWASDGAHGDSFGDLDSVAADGGRALIGALGADIGHDDTGAAYVFDLEDLEAACAVFNSVPPNPEGFQCAQGPVVGEAWIASFTDVEATTAWVGFALGPATGNPIPNASGWILVTLPPSLVVFGTPASPPMVEVPCDPKLVGAEVAAQGFRIDNAGGVVTCTFFNGLNLVVGTY